jgi:hypothetical protein
VKINLKEGTIELEGSEAFVTNYLEIFRKEMQELRLPTTAKVSEPKKKVKEEKPRRVSRKAPTTIIPIPLDLKEKDDKPSLRKFFKEKAPKSYAEKVTVFAYYLKKYLKINRMEAGHVVSCCKEVQSKAPTEISQLFYDVQRHQGWLNISNGRNFAEINLSGENFVEYDLPRKENAKQSKATT